MQAVATGVATSVGEMSEGSHWRAFASLLGPHRRRVAAMGLLLAVAGILPLAGPLLIARFIDAAIDGATARRLTVLALIYVTIGVVRQAMALLVAWSATDVAWRVTNELRSDLTNHVLGLDLAFHRSTSPGELVSRVDGDVTALSDFVARFAVKAVAALVTLAGIVVVLLLRDWRVGLGLAVYLSLALATVTRLRDYAVDEAASEQAATGQMLGEIEERLVGADDLRGNGGGSHAVATFQVASRRVLRSVLNRERQGVALWIISNAVFIVGGLVALTVDVVLLRQGAISLGTAYLIFQYTQIMREPLGQLADETERVQRAAGGMVRTLELLGESSTIRDDGVAQVASGALSVEIENLTFSYPDDDEPVPVLDEVSLDLAAGRTIGVLGRTGSGKTTLARLLQRLVEPTTGTIRLGGVPLQEIPLHELRARTGVVSQDVHLFGTTIRENLTLYDESITDTELRTALAELDLAGWVDAMPQGLDTVLGPEGAGLSAGEGQLIALARLFLRSPDLVVLDEASSRIDPDTEHRVTAAFDRLLDGRTAIVIAHRLSTVERLDEVLVLDNGRIVERGETAVLRNDPTSRYAQLLAIGLDTVDELDAGVAR